MSVREFNGSLSWERLATAPPLNITADVKAYLHLLLHLWNAVDVHFLFPLYPYVLLQPGLRADGFGEQGSIVVENLPERYHKQSFSCPSQPSKYW